ncbi:MAG: glutamine-hydrolyzing GMP synthase [Clostridia bacterium]|nr:glutamine-hydrolyzing GMP synthase [Clostridia bacterium]
MEKILVLDFGGQYNQLIARRVRELSVFAEIIPYNKITPAEIKAAGYKGVIFTGGPNSVYDESSPHYPAEILDAGVPVLGICYGCQLIAYMGGGEICSAVGISEYGKTGLTVKENPLFDGVPETGICWMSHTDYVKTPPEGFEITAFTDNCPCAALCNKEKNIYGVQFHPEVTHTQYGRKMIENFVMNICGCAGDWTTDDFIETSVNKYREELAGKKVLCALSGGVDSSVAAVLLHKAIGSNLICVFVDHGLLRKNEGDMVERVMKEEMGLNLIRINAEDRFLSKLAGVTKPEEKRKIIGAEFIRVFEDVAKDIGKVDVLVQGTIYPDVIESGKGDAAVIKSHHNVGGLPDVIRFERIVEPLRDLFKDEVRAAGRKLGIPEDLVSRQPFPGPGLAIRVIGEITKEKLDILRESDAIFREEIANAGLTGEINQYFTVLTNCRTVGVMGDAGTYGYTLALRAVTTDDFMTADWSRIPFDVLASASNRITNEVRSIGRVVYDITAKPPATVEWE